MTDRASLFRLRAFEEDWLHPLIASLDVAPEAARSFAQATPFNELPSEMRLNAVLAAEGINWIRLGQDVGYFARTEIRYQPVPEVERLRRRFRQRERDQLDAWTFDRFLETAIAELTVDRREYLRLVFVAPVDEWEERLEAMAALAAQLEEQPELSLSSESVDALSWGLDGAVSDLEASDDLPCDWRAGPITIARAVDLEEFRARILVALRRPASRPAAAVAAATPPMTEFLERAQVEATMLGWLQRSSEEASDAEEEPPELLYE